MRKFRRKPIIFEAEQWFEVSPYVEGERRLVDYFRTPDPLFSGPQICTQCSRAFHDHGWMDTLEGGHRVCPGDWIVKGVKGEFWPVKPDVFAETYEEVA